MNPRRPESALAKDAAEKAAAREAEAACRRDFLRRPDHEKRCICSPPCSRDYDPLPYPKTVAHAFTEHPAVISARQKALPAGDALYEGTGIGALYGGRMSAAQAASLAGWNIKPGSTSE